MNNITKSEEAYKTIGEVTKALGLIDKKSGKLQTHTIRYWETQFKQIVPKIRAGRRRYYSLKTFKIIKNIKYLLKDRGLTIKGVKKILGNTHAPSIDADTNIGINTSNFETKNFIKSKIKNISNIIKELKKYK